MIWLPVEELIPFAAEKFLVVDSCPFVELMECVFCKTGILKGGLTFGVRLCHAQARVQLVRIQKRCSAYRIEYKFEICRLQRFRYVLDEGKSLFFDILVFCKSPCDISGSIVDEMDMRILSGCHQAIV